MILSFAFPSFGDWPEIELAGEVQLPGRAHISKDLIVREQKAYLAHWEPRLENARVFVVNLSAPGNPSIAGTYISNSSGSKEGFETPSTFRMDLEYPYLYIPRFGGFDIVDISIPTLPALTGTYESQTAGHAINVEGTRAIFTHDNRIEFVNIEHKERPEFAAMLELDLPARRAERGIDIIWDGGDYAFILYQSFSRGPPESGGSLNATHPDYKPFQLFHPFYRQMDFPKMPLESSTNIRVVL